jgi:serine/threonine protein kinase
VTLQLQSAISPIPGYELQERIGTGGYGEVWRSTAPGGLLKAVKFVFGYMDDERATRELKALQRIREVRHPFLLSLERIEVVEGQLVIVTELADGSLKDRFVQCRQEGLPGIPRDELLEHLRDAAAALDFMSERHSLQHLDVKPENLLLVGGRVKVADFGLVKDLIDGSISLMGSMTPIYAPPEVFDGRPSRASDQYSLAIVYQEMLTGVLPFPGKTLAQLAAQHLSSRPRLAALPTADHAAVALALAKDPAARELSRLDRGAVLGRPILAAGRGDRIGLRRGTNVREVRYQDQRQVANACGAADTSEAISQTRLGGARLQDGRAGFRSRGVGAGRELANGRVGGFVGWRRPRVGRSARGRR